MKTILITSNLTYVPGNYDNVLESVLCDSQKHITAVILVKINLLNISSKLPFFYFIGCKNITNVLIAHGEANSSSSNINSFINPTFLDFDLIFCGSVIYKESLIKYSGVAEDQIITNAMPPYDILYNRMLYKYNNREQILLES